MAGKRVVVGMSGGVDSSVAACLLQEQGYEVIGVTMQIWQDEDRTAIEENGGCCGLLAVEDARRVANILGIPYYVMNFKEIFQEKVIDYFVDSYLCGQTPNPCIACNRYVKWEALLRRSLEIGADYIATGHYARVEMLPNGRLAVRNSVTEAKDQTYALYNLTQDQLRRTLMPVGAYTKEEIRAIARRRGFLVAEKPDSQEICFVPDHDYAGFILKYEAKRRGAGQSPCGNRSCLTEGGTAEYSGQGNFVTKDGIVLGTHKGIIHYTVGQRKGLGLSMGRPVFVTEIRPETNEVVIGEAEDVFTDTLICEKLNLMAASEWEEGKIYLGKIRYGHRGERCQVKQIGEDLLECRFEKPVRAVTPGQALVIYDGEYVAGGGTILSGQKWEK